MLRALGAAAEAAEAAGDGGRFGAFCRASLVDTVEKMQGQQKDLVVVCYGYLDRDALGADLDFVYSRNRLVVALSRARKKVVLLAGAPLLEGASLEVFERRERRAGLELLQRLEARAAAVQQPAGAPAAAAAAAAAAEVAAVPYLCDVVVPDDGLPGLAALFSGVRASPC